MRIPITVFFALGTLATAAEFPCEPGSSTREALKRLDVQNLTGVKRTEAQRGILEGLLAANPDDMFLHLRKIDLDRSSAARQAAIDRYRALSEKQKDNHLYAMLYAKALIGTDTPRALEMLKQLSNSDAKLAWPNMLLADIYSFGKFTDRVALRQSLDTFFTACPTTLASQPLGTLVRFGTPELAQKYAGPLRVRLSAETDPGLVQRWSELWNLEFKAHPPTEHVQLRKQVAADVARLENIQPAPDAAFLNLLLSGYQNAGDEAGVRRTEERILTQHADTFAARSILRARHEKEHKYPGNDASDEVKAAYQRESLRFTEEQLKTSPGEFEFLLSRFSALSQLEDTSKEQLTEAGEAVLGALRKGVNMWGTPPFAFQVARAYVKKDIHLDQIPALIEMGRKDVQEHEYVFTDRDPDETKKMFAQSALFVRIEAAQILLDAAKKTNNLDSARAAVDNLSGVTGDKPYLQSSLWTVRAKLAELDGRKLDALLMYRAALDARPSDFQKPKKDEIAESANRLWKELGGSNAGRELWTAKTVEVAQKEGRWEKMDRPLPPWQLSDLEGKTWKLVQLEGKTLLVNLWATWCGPCRVEHPQFQKLYENLKGRADIEVVTFNVDDEIGKVALYMKENHYTFPVLLAKNYVDDLIPMLSIPRNWVVDAKGKWRWEQIGFGGVEKWQEDMLGKLEAAKLDTQKPH